jgi:hypothetical protein
MRAAVVLRHWLDLSGEETAELMNCSEGTVKSQTAKAAARLRDLLSQAAAGERAAWCVRRAAQYPDPDLPDRRRPTGRHPGAGVAGLEQRRARKVRQRRAQVLVIAQQGRG